MYIYFIITILFLRQPLKRTVEWTCFNGLFKHLPWQMGGYYIDPSVSDGSITSWMGVPAQDPLSMTCVISLIECRNHNLIHYRIQI